MKALLTCNYLARGADGGQRGGGGGQEAIVEGKDVLGNPRDDVLIVLSYAILLHFVYLILYFSLESLVGFF